MGQGRPTGASYGAAHATIDLDLAALTAAPRVAQAAGEATAKALQQSLRIVQNEQKIAIEGAKQATAAVQAQQAQITAASRAQSQERIQQARAESVAQQQQARATATTVIEEERRKTAQLKQEIRDRNRSQVSGSSFGQNVASFAGAALGGPIGGLVGAATMGNPAIAAGLAVNMGARFAVDAAQIATAYNRQNVAALQLAGSQSKLNSLMAVYDKATGGIVSKSDELANVTKLQAVGFADSTKELDQFARSIRGISIAMGTSADTVTQNLILELFSQRGQRLDQLGLQYDLVRKRSAELQAQDSTLTKQMAYQQAVLEQAIDRYGALGDSAAGAGTGLEKLSKAWADFQLQQGQNTGSATNMVAGFFADIINKGNQVGSASQEAAASRNFSVPSGATDQQREGIRQAASLADAQNFFRSAGNLFTQMQYFFAGATAAQKEQLTMRQRVEAFQATRYISPNASRGDSGYSANGPSAADRFSTDQEAVLVEWNTKRVAIEHESQAAVVAEARAWGNQRLEAERSFTKTSVREAQDWATQQSRTQQDYQESQAKNATNYAKSQAREERDLGRSIAREQADDAEKVADIRKDSSKRLQDIEEGYADQRAKAARDHSDNLLEAAGNLDAKAVYQEQRKYAEQLQDSQKAHDKQLKENKSQLQERLDDERKSLDKSISQQRTALDQQEADQKADYDERNTDAQAQFTKEQARAEQDRGVRLGRMAQDQQDQLDAIDRGHDANMAAIAQRTDDEKKSIQTILTDAHIAVKGFVDTSVDDAIKAYDKYYTHMDDVLSGKIKPGDAARQGIPANRSGAGGNADTYTPASSPAGFANGGWVQRGGMARVHAGEFVMPAPAAQAMASGGGGRSVHFGDIHLHITGNANMGPDDWHTVIYGALNDLLEGRAA